MATFIGHGILSYTICKIAKTKVSNKLMLVAIISSILPDLDVIGFYLGIPYDSMLGHRGFSHSILFALIWSYLLAKTTFRHSYTLAFPILLTCTMSHGIIDALTTGGRGIGFFIPFTGERYFFPTQMIQVSPLHIEDFWGTWGLSVVRSEAIFIGFPCLLLLLINWFYTRIASDRDS